MDARVAARNPHEVESHSVRRIKRIAERVAARSYLEIGVARGKTFNNLAFARKVAVDPKFRFDVRQYRREGVEFHALPSDRYFALFGASEKFDIIFLDGLHKFQQTFRDFCNSLCCAHDRTVWLVDDVLPNDVYSAWPVQSEAYAFRKRAGGDSLAWHGDAYKLLFVIHDFFPALSYVTLKGPSNAQTLVWKAARLDAVPVFDSLEAIERLGYFDLLKREDIFNFKSEADGFAEFFASLERSQGRPREP